jgi:hypothetical protein
MRPSGVRRLVFALPALWLAACAYGFAGGGLPSHVRTVAVLPFENETPAPELQRELLEQMRRDIRSRLSLRDAAVASADALVRGTIVRYETDIPVGISADRRRTATAKRKLQVTVDAEIIDQTTGKVLWQRKGVVGEGEYLEGAEAEARRTAMERIVSDIIEGAQSQW